MAYVTGAISEDWLTFCSTRSSKWGPIIQLFWDVSRSNKKAEVAKKRKGGQHNDDEVIKGKRLA